MKLKLSQSKRAARTETTHITTLIMSHKSHQMCSCCGWSKVTTYQGLRIHQGRMGCTPKGRSIPQSDQYLYSPLYSSYSESAASYTPPPPIKNEIDSVYRGLESLYQANISAPQYFSSITKETSSQPKPAAAAEATVRVKNKPAVEAPKDHLYSSNNKSSPGPGLSTGAEIEEKKLQTCHCGWSKVTSYQGLRIHQGRMGCTPKGLSIPEDLQYAFTTLSHEAPPAKPEEKPHGLKAGKDLNKDLVEELKNTLTKPNKKRRSIIKPALKPMSTDAPVKEEAKSRVCEELKKTDENPMNQSAPKEKPPIIRPKPVLKPLSQSTPENSKVRVKEENKSRFETPQQSGQPPVDGTKSRRALDFTTSKEQVTKDKIKAEIHFHVRSRLQKVSEVRSRVKACKGSLDVEWLEINSVFSEAIKVMEEARQRALQPLENRREELKREANTVIKKLQEDIEKLEKAVVEVDTAADLDMTFLTKLKSKDCLVDTSFSFGTLRATISNIMEQIQQELEKLSAVELKRIASFAVDVKLDPDTAHQWLTVPKKQEQKVQDGGQSRQVFAAPVRFSSGRSYWEVEVGTETGWDLGVVSTKANREGKLSPDNGFWAIAHYQGGKYAALTAPPVCLELKDKPQKVGVFLDYEEGLVSFYNVTAQTHIHSFTKCCFNDKIYPYVRVSTVKN